MATKDSGNSQGQTTPNAPQIDNIDEVTNVDENNRSLDDVNDVGGNIDKGQAHDDFNGGGDVLGRRGGGPGEKSGLGKEPTPHGKQPHTISDKDTGHGTHRGGMGPGHSGQKGNHQGEDTQSPGQNTPGKNRKDELSTGSLDNQAGLKEEGEGGQQPRKR